MNTAKEWGFRQGCRCLLTLAIMVIAVKPGLADTQDNGEIVPGNVFAVLKEFAEELESLRFYMGAQRPNTLTIEIREAAPHDVYFEALALFEKVNRLSFEQIRVQIDPPSMQAGVFTPADVLYVVRAADDAIHLVLAEFGLHEIPDKFSPAPDKSPSDVFEAIRQINRQLNIILEQRFKPSDVYMQVTFAVGYASNLLAPFSDAPRIPDEPLPEQGKVPSDVFFRLVECLNILSRIYELNEFPSLHLDISKTDPGNITPSDSYDMASLAVARLDFLQRRLPDIKEPLPPFYPGRMFPSDVYQRVGLLKLQLEELEARSRSAQAVSPYLSDGAGTAA